MTPFTVGVRCLKCKKVLEVRVENEKMRRMAQKIVDRASRNHFQECKGYLTQFSDEVGQ